MSLNHYQFHRRTQLDKLLRDPNKTKHALESEQDSLDELSTDLMGWLGRLKLFYGVPFHYLVPDNRMLPPESLRFFQVDNNWLYALIDGAYSIGRNTQVDHVQDGARMTRTHQRIHHAARQIRSQLMGQGVSESTADATGIPPVSGFLIRSSAVSTWPGMRVQGYSDKTSETRLKTLRYEKIAGDILLCLFEGIVESIVLSEPSESLHYAISDIKRDDPSDPKYLKTMVEVYGDSIGNPLPDKPEAEIVLSNKANRVIDFEQTATAMTQIIQPPTDVQFNSAHLAIELSFTDKRVKIHAE